MKQKIKQILDIVIIPLCKGFFTALLFMLAIEIFLLKEERKDVQRLGFELEQAIEKVKQSTEYKKAKVVLTEKDQISWTVNK